MTRVLAVPPTKPNGGSSPLELRCTRWDQVDDCMSQCEGSLAEGVVPHGKAFAAGVGRPPGGGGVAPVRAYGAGALLHDLGSDRLGGRMGHLQGVCLGPTGRDDGAAGRRARSRSLALGSVPGSPGVVLHGAQAP